MCPHGLADTAAGVDGIADVDDEVGEFLCGVAPRAKEPVLVVLTAGQNDPTCSRRAERDASPDGRPNIIDLEGIEPLAVRG